MNKEKSLWNEVDVKGFPESTGRYLTILEDDSLLGMQEPEMTFFFKKGTHLHLFLDKEKCDSTDADIYVINDGFYKVTDNWREKYLKRLPVLYWMEMPNLPDNFITELAEKRRMKIEAMMIN